MKIAQMESAALSPDPTLPPGVPLIWLGHVRPTPTSSVPMISAQITLVIIQEALRHIPNYKAARPDGVPGLVVMHMPPTFHETLHLLSQTMAITGITPPFWLKSHPLLLYTKGNLTRLDNYRPIIMADAFIKLWATCKINLATKYIKSRKIISPKQEGCRADRSCARAVTNLSLCVEDIHFHKKDIPLLSRF